ncbi:MAG TPA: hypothetical protein DEO88_02025 [Syntrophobacteraceae bacterium]|nr:hypothetical protein [Syntrophobacteraceae bacterium]
MEKHITVGVAGHVDHGKTSLVRCLTRYFLLKKEPSTEASAEPGRQVHELPYGPS